VLQGGDEIGLGDPQLVAAQQLPQGRGGDAHEYRDDGEHHDLLDQGHAALPAQRPGIP
jgi:hypothetical protein